MKILAVSDKETELFVFKDKKFNDVEFILSCGDLNENFLNDLSVTLSKPIYYILGNHDPSIKGIKLLPKSNYIHLKFLILKKVVILGISGSLKYNSGENQYSQIEMYILTFFIILKYILKLIFLRRKNKKFIILTHSPIFDIHDIKDSSTHRGFRSFKILLKLLKPDLWIHGHIHLETHNSERITKIKNTTIINIYGYKIIEIKDGEISTSN